MDKVIKKKSWIIRRKYTLSFGLLIFCFIIYLAVFADHSSKYNVETEKISIAEVKNDYFQDYITVNGIVEPIKTVIIAAIEGGRVEEIFVEESTNVNKGDTILKLGNPKLILEISNNEAQVSRSINDLQMSKLNMQTSMMNLKSNILDMRMNLVDKRRTYRINKRLFDKNLISKIEFLKSEEDYNTTLEKTKILNERKKNDSIFNRLQLLSLSKSVSRMRQNLEMVRKRVDNLYVKAPCNGQLAQIVPEIGQVIPLGANIGKVNVLDSYKLRLEIDEHYLSRVNKFVTGQCQFDNKYYAGRIKKIYKEVENGKFFVDMIFTKDLPTQINIGQRSRIKLELGKSKKAILIPRGAFYQDTGGRWIFVVDKSGKFATKRTIEIGRYNPNYYEVESGLEPGERVIVSGYDLFGKVEKLILD